jgi:hypothetical protein
VEVVVVLRTPPWLMKNGVAPAECCKGTNTVGAVAAVAAAAGTSAGSMSAHAAMPARSGDRWKDMGLLVDASLSGGGGGRRK